MPSPTIVWKLSWFHEYQLTSLKSLFPTTQVSILDFEKARLVSSSIISLLQALGEAPKVEIKHMNFKGATLMAVSQDNQILLKGDMGDDEITALANYIPQSKLEHLDLEHNRLSLLSITALANALPKTGTFEIVES